jgi:hypothetical protein
MDSPSAIGFDTAIKTAYVRFEKNTRYYELHLGKDLFDNWSITRVNGRIKSRLGQYHHEPFGSFAEAIIRMSRLSQYRTEKRKYKLVKPYYV